MLGYKVHLERDRNSGNLHFQEKLGSTLKIFDTVDEKVFRVQAISDTIIITCATHDDFPQFLSILQKVFFAFLSQGLFIRGGIAYSRHFQRNHMTYSHAIARAYELESKKAVYPRIVIDENIIQMYEGGSNLPKLKDMKLICVQNRTFFLNVLSEENWPDVYRLCSTLYSEDRTIIEEDEGVFAKHFWFENFLLQSEFAPADAKPYIHKAVFY